MRRKRDDDSSLSMCSDCQTDPLAGIDASSLSQADSNRACRKPKKRRTIVDAFQNFNLDRSIPQEAVLGGVEDDSSLLAGGPETDNHSLTSDSEDDKSISVAGRAQRAVLLQLVFGQKPAGTPPVDPVDAKVESLIRESLHKAVAGEPFTQDDMTIDAAYSRASSTSEFDFFPRRSRSNSLPMEFDEVSDAKLAADTTATMDLAS
jgi:hypothetical protein